VVSYEVFQAFSLGIEKNKKTANINVKNDVYKKTLIGDVVAHLKPQKFTVCQICNVLYHHYMLSRMLLAV